MSGNYWLERDPKDSPGLQRIQEAQQAAATAKAQAEQQAHGAAIAAQEAERKRLEMIARIEQKTAQVLPLLEEIRDYANQTGTYPLGEDYDKKAWLEQGLTPKIEIIRKAEITEFSYDLNIYDPNKPAKSIELKYGYRGYSPRYGRESDGQIDGSSWRVFEGWANAVVFYGIKLKIANDGTPTVLKKETVHVPYNPGSSSGRAQREPVPAHDEVRVFETLLPEDPNLQKDMLSLIFHDPVHLETVESPPVRQNKDKPEVVDIPTDIFGSIRALLGIKS